MFANYLGYPFLPVLTDFKDYDPLLASVLKLSFSLIGLWRSFD